MNFDSIVHAVTLGIVQGLTEWLPISSTAHLKLVPALLHWKDPGAAGTAVMQLGTTVAVLLYFWKDLWGMTLAFLKSLRPGASKTSLEARLGWAVVLGTIPVAVIGLATKKYIEGPLRSPTVIGAAMILMAILLFVAEMVAKHKRGIDQITINDGWAVGAAQAIALIPGASRSGSTLMGALFIGLNREAAARFSFLLSVPAVLLSGLFELKDLHKPHDPGTMDWHAPEMLLATLVAGFVGYASIHFLLKFLRTNTTMVFIIYRVVVGLIVLYLASTGFIK